MDGLGNGSCPLLYLLFLFIVYQIAVIHQQITRLSGYLLEQFVNASFAPGQMNGLPESIFLLCQTRNEPEYGLDNQNHEQVSDASLHHSVKIRVEPSFR